MSGNGGGRRLRSFALLSLLAFVLAGFGAQAALATPGEPGKPRFHNELTCHSVTFNFTGFPEAPNNVIRLKIKVNGVTTPFAYSGTYTFNGSSGSVTIPITIPAGHNEVTAYAEYNTNGVKGESDYKFIGGITCAAEPGFTIEKLQEIAGSGTGFTSSELTGKIGQTVDYRIVVTNTGNTPLTLSGFTDENCEPGTLAGPGENPLALGKSTDYTCSRKLPGVGVYYNSATVTGTPPEGDGEPSTKTSNEVVTKVPAEPRFTILKKQEIAGSGTGFTTAQLAASVGQTVDYQMTVTNTGNVPLTFSNFTDAVCDELTIVPGASELAPGESTVYTCEHVITEADKTAGLIINTATDTGTPPEGDGTPVTNTSNEVIVEVPLPRPRFKNVLECTGVTYNFTGFPNRNNNVVTLKIKVNGVIVYTTKYHFNGTSGSVTIPFVPPLVGHNEVTAYAEYNTNGVKGESDWKFQGGITCEEKEVEEK
ncbi:MAG TPA: hypothetical protein VKG62_07035 [Solirubrobacteraceae bacterium]|nr:hypothetical protein [Solirubrobacteraceae bacterium]